MSTAAAAGTFDRRDGGIWPCGATSAAPGAARPAVATTRTGARDQRDGGPDRDAGPRL